MTDPLALNRVPGRLRDSLTPVDLPVLCKEPEHRDVFDGVLEGANRSDKDDSKRHARYVTAAKAICGQCPILVRTACLKAHGRDYELGVVGGMTDSERRAKFDGAA